MISVATIQQWKAEGRAEGLAEGMALGMQEARRSDLLRVIRLRFADAPHDLVATVRGMSDLDQLSRWFEAALIAPSIEHLRLMAQDADQLAAQRRRR